MRVLKTLAPFVLAVGVLFPCRAQKLTINKRNVPIELILEIIRDKSAYSVNASPDIFRDAPPVSVDCHNCVVEDVLQSCFAGLKLGFYVEGLRITLFRKTAMDASLYQPISGRVTGPDGELLAGASIQSEGRVIAYADERGNFSVPARSFRDSLQFSYMGFQSKQLSLNNTEFHIIHLQSAVSTLGPVVIAYGYTTEQANTGSIGIVKPDLLTMEPVGNINAALESRVPGLDIRMNNGLPGSNYQVMIRGAHSIAQGTAPLVIVDGVPMPGNNGSLTTIGTGSAQGAMGASPLNGIPPGILANAAVLKDASATSIYGSRSANGILLLTLSQGTPGPAKFTVDCWTGTTATVKTSPLLSTPQYMALRKEAVANAQEPININTLPELFNWDSTRNTNFKKLVTGTAGIIRNTHIELTGGDTSTVYLLSANYYRETAVYPTASNDQRWSVYGHIHHTSGNRRLHFDMSELYSWEVNLLPMWDLTFIEYLAPNTPALRQPGGELVWGDNGLSFENVYGWGNNTYKASVANQFNHLQLGYDLFPGLSLKASFGYSQLHAEENSRMTIGGQDPAIHPTGNKYYTGNSAHSELAEGIGEYCRMMGKGRLSLLVGASWQEQRSVVSDLSQLGFTSDLLLGSGATAPHTFADENDIAYRYQAYFGRLNYAYMDQYFVTFAGRRDGSSRLGPKEKYGNFWSASGAWIFSTRPFFRHWRWLSFGKLRLSIGTTGNDDIGDNLFSQVYTNTGGQGQQGVYPVSFSNNKLGWEVNYNSEAAVDLGFLRNQLRLSVSAYRDWTTSQLLFQHLPNQTGLRGVFTDLPVRVTNTGFEISLEGHYAFRALKAKTLFSLSAPVNRLAYFPGLANSIYAGNLMLGKSLTEQRGYHYTGVDARTGLFSFQDRDGNGVLNAKDVVPAGDTDPRLYGSLQQTLQYGHFELDVLFAYRVQKGFNPFFSFYRQTLPGMPAAAMLSNGPVELLDHWRQPGDHARLQRVSAQPDSAMAASAGNYLSSDAVLVNANFIRLKNLSLRYRLTGKWLRRYWLCGGQVYLRGENLFTFTRFPITDPETQDPQVLPPVRTVACGIQLSF
jgi:TonB-linked SusC/RagA family outer membrane protein